MSGRGETTTLIRLSQGLMGRGHGFVEVEIAAGVRRYPIVRVRGESWMDSDSFDAETLRRFARAILAAVGDDTEEEAGR